MITASFELKEARILGFTCRGHSGLALEGQDIVCAAVSSAVRLAECAVNDVLGLGAKVAVDDKNAAVSLTLPDGLEPVEEETCQTVLTALMISLSRIQEEYPDNIAVLEV